MSNLVLKQMIQDIGRRSDSVRSGEADIMRILKGSYSEEEPALIASKQVVEEHMR